jgi:predicted nucleotidyltransferase
MAIVQYTEFRKTWIERKRREERDVLALQTLLMEKVKVCANEIKKLGGNKVILFGSLAAGRFRKGSDVDIAVEGITAKAYFRALGIIEETLGDVPFDLVDLKEALPSVKKKVEKEGIILA